MRFVALVLLAMLVAGCSSGGSGGDGGGGGHEPPPSPPGTGLILGTVTDEAIVPLPNARVSALGPDGSTHDATTGEDGSFTMVGLTPGLWIVRAEKAGFHTRELPANVVEDEDDPEPLLLRLSADEASRPYPMQYTATGYVACNAGVGVSDPYAQFSSECWGSGLYDTLGENIAFVNYTLDRLPTFVQAELIWRSTQNVNSWLSFGFAHPDSGEFDRWQDQENSGPPPLLVARLEGEDLRNYTLAGWGLEEGDRPELALRLFGHPDDGTGPVVTVQQEVQIITTVFYGYKPDEAWTFAETGEIPPPE